MVARNVATLFVILLAYSAFADPGRELIEASRNGQDDIFVVTVYSEDQWDQLSRVEPPDGVEGDPVAQNNRYLFDYSAGHYSANDEMHKRRGEIRIIMKTLVVEDVDS